MIQFFKRRSRAERALTKARKLIQRQGWTQGVGKIYNPGGTCAAYAIAQACRKLDYDTDVVLALFADRNALPTVAAYGEMTPTQRVVSWNDAGGRSEMEVLRAFRTAESAT